MSRNIIGRAGRAMRIKRMIVLLLFLASWANVAQADETLNICAEDGWAPYSSARGGVPHGASLELVRRALQEAGSARRLDFEAGSFQRCLMLTQKGEYDALLDVARTHQRAAHYRWPEQPLFEVPLLLIAPAGHADVVPHYALLAGHRLGTTLGYDYPDEVEGNAAIDKVVGRSELVALRQLAAGKVDYVIVSRRTWLTLQPTLGPSMKSLRSLGEIGRFPVYLAFSLHSHDTDAAIAEFDRGMAALRQRGEDLRILSRWGAAP
ncbi:substrate-binding periplasmic protein [Chitinibacteraceae bacterium HSL-7]